MQLHTGARAFMTSLAVSAALLLSGCSGSSTSATSWDPPRPAGLTDDLWASVSVDPATSIDTPERLAEDCKTLKPATASDVEMFLAMAPESNEQDWNAYLLYFYEYATKLCAGTPGRAPASSSSS